MQLRAHTLTGDELEHLDRIWAAVYLDEALRDFVRPNLQNFLLRRGLKLPPYALARLMREPSSRKYAHAVALYDFAGEKLMQVVNDHAGTDDATRAQFSIWLEDMATLRAAAMGSTVNSLADMNDHLSLTDRAGAVPGNFLGKYFGYRRSATAGEIIRFYVNIKSSPGNDRQVDFFNEYVRGAVHWKVEGIGYYIHTTLYLIGQALNAAAAARRAGDDDSLGLRFFALKPLGATGCLVGPIMSMDRLEHPIAARALLVPLHKHTIAGKAAPALDHTGVVEMIRASPDYEEEVRPQIGGALGEFGPDYFLHLIRNNTMTVLRESIAGEASHFSIAVMEERIRAFCHANHLAMEEALGHRYEAMLQGYIDTVMSGAPG